MPIRVQVPDVGIVQFPDGTDPETISKSLNEKFGKKSGWYSPAELGRGLERGALSAVGQVSKALASLSPGFSAGDDLASALQDPRMGKEVIPTPTPAALLKDISTDPFQKFGERTEAKAAAVPEPKTILGEAGEMAAGMAPIVATGPFGPVTIGMMGGAGSIGDQYNANKKTGMSDEDAAEKAIKTGFTLGLSEGAIWGILPKPIKSVISKVTGDIGGKGVAKFFARRTAGAVEGAALGASSQLTHNVALGQPAGQGVLPAALGTGAAMAFTPYRQPKAAPARPKVNPAALGESGDWQGPLQTGENLDLSRPKPVGYKPKRKPKPPVEVPATPAEPQRQTTVTDEIRAAGANTAKKVQAYWLRRTGQNINLAVARELRDAAFPKAQPEQQGPPAPAEDQDESTPATPATPRSAWEKAKQQKAKGGQNAIPVGSAATVPVQVPPGTGPEVGARVPAPEQPAAPQAKVQATPEAIADLRARYEKARGLLGDDDPTVRDMKSNLDNMVPKQSPPPPPEKSKPASTVSPAVEGDGSVAPGQDIVEEQIAKLRKDLTARGISVSTIEREYPNTKEGRAAFRDRLVELPGPGAATRGGEDIGGGSQIEQLERSFRGVQGKKLSWKEIVRQAFKGNDVLQNTKAAVSFSIDKLKAGMAELSKRHVAPDMVDDMTRAKAELSGVKEAVGVLMKRFSDRVKRQMPDIKERGAISKWVNAGGDEALLRRGLAEAPEETKQYYRDALNLSPDAKVVARNIMNFSDARLQEAIDSGAIDDGVEHWLHRIYENSPELGKRAASFANSGILKTSLSSAKKRIFEFDWEAEKWAAEHGKRVVHDFLPRLVSYEEELTKAIQARKFVRSMIGYTDDNGNRVPGLIASDGRPAFDVKGVGNPVEKQEYMVMREGSDRAARVFDNLDDAHAAAAELGGEYSVVPRINKATIIKPQFDPSKSSNEADSNNYRGDYETRPYSALQKWKWVANDTAGNPIIVGGDIAIHPEFVKRVDNLFKPSQIRYGSHPLLGKVVLGVSSTVKNTMLDLFTGFHQVQEGVHGSEHHVLPASFLPKVGSWIPMIKEIDLKHPDVQLGLRTGLTLGGDSRYQSEGLFGRSLTRLIPGLGQLSEAYHEYLFKDYIPRLKTTMFLEALNRNRKRFPGWSEERLGFKTSRQANAAFGGQNVIVEEVSKTSQDLAQIFFLAPDFLKQRAKFVAQAFERGGDIKAIEGLPASFDKANIAAGRFLIGNEQRTALLLGGLAMWVTARIMNKAISNNYRFEKDNMFSVVYNGRSYGLRTVQGDAIHALTQPLNFWLHRLNPATTRPLLEELSERDEFGRSRNWYQRLGDDLSVIIPISLRFSRERSLLESIQNSFGLMERRFNDSDQAFKLAKAWKDKNGIRSPGEFIYDPDADPLRPLKIALSQQNEGAAAAEIKKLVESKQRNLAKLAIYFNRYGSMPLTGSRAHDREFFKSLPDSEKQTVLSAMQSKHDIRKLYFNSAAQYLAAKRAERAEAEK